MLRRCGRWCCAIYGKRGRRTRADSVVDATSFAGDTSRDRGLATKDGTIEVGGRSNTYFNWYKSRVWSTKSILQIEESPLEAKVARGSRHGNGRGRRCDSDDRRGIAPAATNRGIRRGAGAVGCLSREGALDRDRIPLDVFATPAVVDRGCRDGGGS